MHNALIINVKSVSFAEISPPGARLLAVLAHRWRCAGRGRSL